MERMKSRTVWMIITTVVATIVLFGGARARLAPLDPQDAVEAAISFQGRLVDASGTPLNGTYDLEFTFWSASSGGSQPWGGTTQTGQTITGGLYNTKLNVDPDTICGQELWLRIRVRETGTATWETLDPRVQVLPAAYAMTLRPGAQIQGEPTASDGAVLKSTLDGYYTNGKALWGVTSATGYGVLGESVDGFGVYGYSPNSYGVWGHSGGSWGGYFSSDTGNGIVAGSSGTTVNDHAGIFSANWGWGVFATSTHNQAFRGEAGDLSAGKSMPGGAWGAVGIGQSGGMWGSSWNNWGVYGDSHNYRGVQGNTERTDRNYGLHTYDNIYSLNYNLAGAVMQLAQNGGDTPLEPGDVAVFSGIANPSETGEPLVQVARATSANSTAVAGVVYSRVNIEAYVDPEVAKAEIDEPEPGDGQNIKINQSAPHEKEVTLEGPVPPGEYLLLVVQGPAQVKASALSGPVQPGDLLSSAGEAGYAAGAAQVTIAGVETTVPGTVFGKALEAVDRGRKLIYVFVTLH
jgi:hypothetical protein